MFSFLKSEPKYAYKRYAYKNKACMLNLAGNNREIQNRGYGNQKKGYEFFANQF